MPGHKLADLTEALRHISLVSQLNIFLPWQFPHSSRGEPSGSHSASHSLRLKYPNFKKRKLWRDRRIFIAYAHTLNPHKHRCPRGPQGGEFRLGCPWSGKAKRHEPSHGNWVHNHTQSHAEEKPGRHTYVTHAHAQNTREYEQYW